MIPFCDNKLCRLHSVQIEGPQFDVVTYKEANGNKCRARRFIIEVKDGDITGKRVSLCEICANAAVMINNG